jgi:hypothetical protein
MKEVLPGIFHWSVVHPKIGIPVSSYYLVDERVLIDPLVPGEGLEAFDKTPPEQVLLTNRHHYRDSGRFAERFGCPVRCVEQGLHEFTQGEKVEGFHFGEILPGGIIAVEVGAICPDETGLLIPKPESVLALADGVVRDGEGPLGFVPDEYMGEDAEGVKTALRQAYRRVLEEHDFEHLLLAHGSPWIDGGKKALADFVGG